MTEETVVVSVREAVPRHLEFEVTAEDVRVAGQYQHNTSRSALRSALEGSLPDTLRIERIHLDYSSDAEDSEVYADIYLQDDPDPVTMFIADARNDLVEWTWGLGFPVKTYVAYRTD